jgi:hypothetical protein
LVPGTNTEIGHIADHWWWARGEVGRYTFIAAHVVATEKYGCTPFHWYMLARDGKPIADDGSRMTLTTQGAQIDEHTGKAHAGFDLLRLRVGHEPQVILGGRACRAVREHRRVRTNLLCARDQRRIVKHDMAGVAG